MKNNVLKKSMIFGIIILFVGAGILPSTVGINEEKQGSMTYTLRGDVLYVGGLGPGNYTTIQAAINDANSGDTVFVFDDSSPYNENVIVNKSINLIGEDKTNTVIDGGGSGDVVYVSADYVTISEFTIQNCGSSGSGVDDCGIKVISNHNIIDRNIITANNRDGLWLYNSDYNIVSNNSIRENDDDGIILYDESHFNVISDNILYSNDDCGMTIQLSCNSNTISDNHISYHNDRGLYLKEYSNQNTISKNHILNNYLGVELDYSNDNTISDNDISYNNYRGLDIDYSSSNTIINNNITSNYDKGIVFSSGSSNNIIYHNNIMNNNQNAYDSSSNTWDDGEYGNYWDDYEERYPDANKKLLQGIWDTPYEIPGGINKDMYPLINQWKKSVSFIVVEKQNIQHTLPLLSWWFQQFLQNHPRMFPILRHLFRLE